jgi:hypothetical protein
MAGKIVLKCEDDSVQFVERHLVWEGEEEHEVNRRKIPSFY